MKPVSLKLCPRTQVRPATATGDDTRRTRHNATGFDAARRKASGARVSRSLSRWPRASEPGPRLEGDADRARTCRTDQFTYTARLPPVPLESVTPLNVALKVPVEPEAPQ